VSSCFCRAAAWPHPPAPGKRPSEKSGEPHTNRHYVYTYPSKKALGAGKDKVRALCRQDINLPLAVLLHRLNRMLRGWTAYFRFGVSHATFQYLRAFTGWCAIEVGACLPGAFVW